MNYLKFLKGISLISFLFLANSLNAQVVSSELWVAGKCDMCEERIINAVDVKGVKSAVWSESDQILRITYKEDKVTLQEICAELIKAGHDTEFILASEEAYDEIHPCCKYARIPQDSIKPFPNQ